MDKTQEQKISNLRERPILFSGTMIRAILEGRKTQTRRIIKPQPTEAGLKWVETKDGFSAWVDKNLNYEEGRMRICPHGRIGDRLWVRETISLESVPYLELSSLRNELKNRPYKFCNELEDLDSHYEIAHYKATDPKPALCCENDGCRQCGKNGEGPHWIPSICMPRWASRITLEITNVRFGRLQDISEDDAKSEGVSMSPKPVFADSSFKKGFEHIWNSIYGTGSWGVNPFVWVIEFRRIEK